MIRGNASYSSNDFKIHSSPGIDLIKMHIPNASIIKCRPKPVGAIETCLHYETSLGYQTSCKILASNTFKTIWGGWDMQEQIAPPRLERSKYWYLNVKLGYARHQAPGSINVASNLFQIAYPSEFCYWRSSDETWLLIHKVKQSWIQMDTSRGAMRKVTLLRHYFGWKYSRVRNQKVS